MTSFFDLLRSLYAHERLATLFSHGGLRKERAVLARIQGGIESMYKFRDSSGET